MTYTVVPDNTDREKLIWESSNPDVLKVNENGKITGLKEGQATITVSSINGTKDKIDDIVPVSDISLSVSEISLTAGQSQTITPIVVPDNASTKVLSFTSTDNSVATVSPNETGTQATITAVSVGYTSIIIRSSNNIEKRLNVIVTSSSSNNNSNSGQNNGSSNSSTQGFKISSKDANNEGYVNATYERTKPANNGATAPVTITVTKTDSSLSKLKVLVCDYPALDNCNDLSRNAITITNSDSFQMNNSGEFVIRVFEYDSNNNLVQTIDKYIWIKGESNNNGLKPTINCQNPSYKNGNSVLLATCSNGKFTDGSTSIYKTSYFEGGYPLTCSNEYGSVTKTCYMRKTTEEPPETKQVASVSATPGSKLKGSVIIGLSGVDVNILPLTIKSNVNIKEIKYCVQDKGETCTVSDSSLTNYYNRALWTKVDKYEGCTSGDAGKTHRIDNKFPAMLSGNITVDDRTNTKEYNIPFCFQPGQSIKVRVYLEDGSQKDFGTYNF